MHAPLTSEMRSGLKDASVRGTLAGADRGGNPGISKADEIIVLADHDSYFEGAFDHASGMATMIRLAEYFSKIIDRVNTLDRAALRPDALKSSTIPRTF